MEIRSISTVKDVSIEGATEAPASSISKGKFVEFLREIDRGENLLDRITAQAMRGRDFSAQELLALQAAVYSYTHKIEMFSKLVDKATSSIRQILQP